MKKAPRYVQRGHELPERNQRRMTAHSQLFDCPVCSQPLCLSHGTYGILLWCGAGKCYSKAANNGASGFDEEAAFAALLKKIDQEETGANN